MINKKDLRKNDLSSSGVCHSDGPLSGNKKSEKINKYLGLARELKMIKKKPKLEHEGDGDTNCSRSTKNGSKRFGK